MKWVTIYRTRGKTCNAGENQCTIRGEYRVADGEPALLTTQTNLLSAVRDSRNTGAWGDFYRIYVPMLGGFFRRLGLSEAEADDVSQEVLVIVLRSLRGNVYDRDKGGFRAWLFGIARRQALAALRQRKRRTRVQTVDPPDGAMLIDQLEDKRGEENLQEVWRQECRYAMLDEALHHVEADVGAKTFQAFVLYALNHLPARQVAEQLGISQSSVYVYKGRVLSAVQCWIEAFEEHERKGPRLDEH